MICLGSHSVGDDKVIEESRFCFLTQDGTFSLKHSNFFFFFYKTQCEGVLMVSRSDRHYPCMKLKQDTDGGGRPR